MIERIETITNDLKRCSGKCRKCRLLDRFSGECMRINNALEYVMIIEKNSFNEKVYCKDCAYCQKTEIDACWKEIIYKCMHREGLPSIYVQPMDYCSKGVRK